MEIKKNILIFCSIWVVLLFVSFFFNYTNAVKNQQNILLQTARTFFDQIVLTRQWNAEHGGVYVPVTSKTKPNPYLNTPLRDIQVNNNLNLTKINPAYMTRQISEISADVEDIHFKITSLNPIRPENKPNKSETIQLKKFEQGTKEAGMFIEENGKTSFFYMAPLLTKKNCLICHTKQGYKIGDIRGGISVILPFVKSIPLAALIIGHLGILLVGLLGIILFGMRLSRAYETINRQATIDTLTNIPNRRSFIESIVREFNRSQRDQLPLSILMCDIDFFKAYNDSYGHSSGDSCLRQIALGISNSLKRPGDVCARWGGEEFVVLLPNTTSEGAFHTAERIRTFIQGLNILHKNSPNQIVTISLGTASMVSDNLSSYEELINQADAALYKAKRMGRNQVQS